MIPGRYIFAAAYGGFLAASATIVVAIERDKRQIRAARRERYINELDINRNTHLHIAARDGDLETFRSLLNEIGANALNRDGNNVLHLAAENGRIEIVKLLLEIYTERKKIEQGSGFLQDFLEDTADLSRRLFSHSLRLRGIDDLNQVNEQGESALCLAAKEGHTEIVAALLNMNVNPNLCDRTERAPLCWAIINGDTRTALMLLQNPKTHLKNDALHLAAQYGRVNVLNFLRSYYTDLNLTNTQGHTPLYVAAKYNHFDMAHQLVLCGAALDHTNMYGVTLLSLAATNNEINAVQILLQLGADPSKKDLFGCSALHMAIINGYEEIAALLLSKGACLDTLEGSPYNIVCSDEDKLKLEAFFSRNKQISLDKGKEEEVEVVNRSITLTYDFEQNARSQSIGGEASNSWEDEAEIKFRTLQLGK